MKVKIIQCTEHITNYIKNIYWIICVDDIEITKFDTYNAALNYSIQQYGHSAVFSS